MQTENTKLLEITHCQCQPLKVKDSIQTGISPILTVLLIDQTVAIACNKKKNFHKGGEMLMIHVWQMEFSGKERRVHEIVWLEEFFSLSYLRMTPVSVSSLDYEYFFDLNNS